MKKQRLAELFSQADDTIERHEESEKIWYSFRIEDITKNTQPYQALSNALYNSDVGKDWGYYVLAEWSDNIGDIVLTLTDDEDIDLDTLNEKLEEYIEADIYTHDLLAWLASDLNHIGYADDAMNEMGTNDIVSSVSCGQYRAKEQLYTAFTSALYSLDEEETEEVE